MCGSDFGLLVFSRENSRNEEVVVVVVMVEEEEEEKLKMRRGKTIEMRRWRRGIKTIEEGK